MFFPPRLVNKLRESGLTGHQTTADALEHLVEHPLNAFIHIKSWARLSDLATQSQGHYTGKGIIL